MKQLFKAGELVIGVVSGNLYTVTKAEYCGATDIDTGIYTIEWHYLLDDGLDIWTDNTGIKKYHNPSTKSFTEIMEELKGPVKA